MPNRVDFPFQDPAQNYAISNFSLSDSDDIARIGEEVPGGLQVQPEGIASHNHAVRAAKLGLSKIQADRWEWTTSFRAIRLTLGQIVRMNNTRLGLSALLIRVTAIKPSRNVETFLLSGHTHNDAWYLDSNGAVDDPAMSTRSTAAARLPHGWQPYYEQPAVGDPMYARTAWTFGLQQDYEARAGSEPGAVVRITGRVPVTEPSTLAAP